MKCSCYAPLQVVETEASREALRKELSNQQRRLAEFEDQARGVEKDLKMALEESRCGERRLEDNRKNLEIQLETTNVELQVCVCHTHHIPYVTLIVAQLKVCSAVTKGSIIVSPMSGLCVYSWECVFHLFIYS